ncbi:pyridoxamine 5'-phosphate oxidase family protein [Cellulomonas sp. zg-ZUI222]|uniref:pyridoxamine 5'-phosphate oxidase family protein n=1 Tax=Cellulomonas TaxID=1707 RepID=UPI001A93B12A|nr:MULTISPECIES: pyridoxamine 5'-phosphate oxidase family protein [Cellulomonas]MBO0899325.1 pyridoxamine 5'-phosphate oxidase family protein [Cellulomonas sp. zg-ZUI22]MBO0920176.1 pyridoxamine 5'-phosphate oxidase family protein [Cellulomonas wangleii]
MTTTPQGQDLPGTTGSTPWSGSTPTPGPSLTPGHSPEPEDGPTRDEALAKVRELLGDHHLAMLTTQDASGALVSRPMGVQDTEFDGDLWFFTTLDSHKVAEIRAGSPANAAFSGSSSWLSISGTADVVRDQARIDELWNPVAAAWFPDGPTTPELCLVRLRAETAEYWDSPGGRLATVLSLVKAKVTGTAYDGGENATVDL